MYVCRYVGVWPHMATVYFVVTNVWVFNKVYTQ